MVLTLDLFQAVAQDVEEILIGSLNNSIEVEFDDGLRLANRFQLSLEVDVASLCFSNVSSVLHNFVWLTIGSKNGIVGRLNPDFFAALRESSKFCRLESACL